MGILTSILGLDGIAGAAAEVTKGITSVLARVIPDADKRMEVEKELQAIYQQGVTAQMQAMQAVMVADSQSDSPLTKNARPILVYWSLFLVTLICVASVFGASDPVVAALAKVPDSLWNVMMYGVGIFAGGRSAEKIASTVATAITARKK